MESGIGTDDRQLDKRAPGLAMGGRRRGPVAKALFATCLIAGALAVMTLVYGFTTFPDAPIRESTNGYVGKYGAPHTREHYERFKLWEKLMLASFGLAFVTGFGAAAAEKFGPRGHGSNRP